jgi:hypothetical protein
MKISKELLGVIKNIDELNSNFFSRMLLSHSNKKYHKFCYDYIDFSVDNKMMISYLPIEKINTLKETYKHDMELFNAAVWSELRYRCKIPKFLLKLISTYNRNYFINNEHMLSLEAEKFFNTYRSIVNIETDFVFRIVEGEDIRKFYHYSTYDNSVSYTLNVSCMRYDTNQHCFDFYVKNPDTIKMLIFINKSNKISGRAILWFNGKKNIMDRIYVNSQEVLDLFKKWAYDNDFYYKTEQNFYNTTHFNFKDKSNLFMKVKIKVKHHVGVNYPYVDTFKWLDNDGYIYNYYPTGKRVKDIKYLVNCDGLYRNCEVFKMCHITNIYYPKSELVYLKYKGIYVNDQLCVYSYFINECFILVEDSIPVTNNYECSYIFNERYNHFNNNELIDIFKNKVHKVTPRKMIFDNYMFGANR